MGAIAYDWFCKTRGQKRLREAKGLTTTESDCSINNRNKRNKIGSIRNRYKIDYNNGGSKTMSTDSSNTEELIKLIPLDKIPNGCKEAKVGDGNTKVQSFLKPLAKALEHNMISSHNCGLLRCNIPTSELTKVANGEGFRGLIQENGKIKGQAIFYENTASMPKSVYVFQALSLATGLYYQHIITEQLSKLSTQIDSIKQHNENHDHGVLQTAINGIHDFGPYSATDALYRINDITKNLSTLREARRKKHRDFDFPHTYSRTTNYAEFKNNIEAIDNDDYISNLDFLHRVESAYYIANMVKYNVYLEAGFDIENLNILCKNLNKGLWSEYEYKHKYVTTYIKKLAASELQSAFTQKKRIVELEAKTLNILKDLEDSFKETEKELKSCSLIIKVEKERSFRFIYLQRRALKLF